MGWCNRCVQPPEIRFNHRKNVATAHFLLSFLGEALSVLQPFGRVAILETHTL